MVHVLIRKYNCTSEAGWFPNSKP